MMCSFDTLKKMVYPLRDSWSSLSPRFHSLNKNKHMDDVLLPADAVV